jgi:hypothetical protein
MSRAPNSTTRQPSPSARCRRPKPPRHARRSVRCWSPWYSPMTRAPRQRKSAVSNHPPCRSKTWTLSSGSGNPARWKASLLRVSMRDALPGRISLRASARQWVPRAPDRDTTARRSSSRDARPAMRESPMTTSSSSERWGPRSDQVSTGATTGNPATSTTRRDSSPRWPTTPARRGMDIDVGRIRWIGDPGCQG